MRTMTVTLLNTDGITPPSQLTVTVPKCGRCKDLIQALSTVCSLQDDETLLVAEVYNHFILRYLEDPSDSLDELIRDQEYLVVYRLPKESENSQLVVFMHQERNLGFRCLFGIPLVTRISDISDGLQIHNAYMKLLRPFLNTDEDGSDDTGNSDYELAKMETIFSNLDDLSSLDDDLENYSDFLFRFSDELGIEGRRINLKKPLDLSDTGSKLHVLVSWPEQMERRYDTSRLRLLPEVFEPGFSAIKPQESVSLSNCLESFLKEEPLGTDEMWYCHSCKQQRQASQKIDLWRLPEILIIHLKRFSYSEVLKDKLETFVDFPLDELDLTGFLLHDSDPSLNRYRLYAIINHFGSFGCGHYTAFIYHGKSWYEFNDASVQPVKEEDVKTSAAYVLFYHRISDT